jgi:hypothetical protein
MESSEPPPKGTHHVKAQQNEQEANAKESGSRSQNGLSAKEVASRIVLGILHDFLLQDTAIGMDVGRNEQDTMHGFAIIIVEAVVEEKGNVVDNQHEF